jgi:hypothetical protein
VLRSLSKNPHFNFTSANGGINSPHCCAFRSFRGRLLHPGLVDTAPILRPSVPLEPKTPLRVYQSFRLDESESSGRPPFTAIPPGHHEFRQAHKRAGSVCNDTDANHNQRFTRSACPQQASRMARCVELRSLFPFQIDEKHPARRILNAGLPETFGRSKWTAEGKRGEEYLYALTRDVLWKLRFARAITGFGSVSLSPCLAVRGGAWSLRGIASEPTPLVP